MLRTHGDLRLVGFALIAAAVWFIFKKW